MEPEKHTGEVLPAGYARIGKLTQAVCHGRLTSASGIRSIAPDIVVNGVLSGSVARVNVGSSTPDMLRLHTRAVHTVIPRGRQGINRNFPTYFFEGASKGIQPRVSPVGPLDNPDSIEYSHAGAHRIAQPRAHAV